MGCNCDGCFYEEVISSSDEHYYKNYYGEETCYYELVSGNYNVSHIIFLLENVKK